MMPNILRGDSCTRGRPSSAAPVAALLALGFGLLGAQGSRAGLGQGVESIAVDHAALHGVAEAVTAGTAFDVHAITLPDETQVREYVSHQGTVFGVAWAGRSKPDLGVLLGQHYAEYALSAAKRANGHKVFVISTQDLVLSVIKLPRGFAGAAHVPALLPPGVSADDIR